MYIHIIYIGFPLDLGISEKNLEELITARQTWTVVEARSPFVFEVDDWG